MVITIHTVMIYITEKRCTSIVAIIVHTNMIIITVNNIVHTVLIHINISQNDGGYIVHVHICQFNITQYTMCVQVMYRGTSLFQPCCYGNQPSVVFLPYLFHTFTHSCFSMSSRESYKCL